MKNFKRLAFACAVATAAFATNAIASVLVSVRQVGTSVVANVSGSLDLTNVARGETETFDRALLLANYETMFFGTSGKFITYNITNSAANFDAGTGPAKAALPSSATGNIFGIYNRSIFVDASYVNNAAISSQMTFDNQTFASLGLKRGEYVYGSGLAAVTLSIRDDAVTGAIPEPATWAMLMVGFGGIGFAMRRKKVTTRIRFA